MNLKTILLIACLTTGTVALARENVVYPDSLGSDRSLGASLPSLLRGKVSGVRVSSVDGNLNGLLNVYVRGVNSLRSDSQPLWVVDGVVLNTGANHNLDAFWQWGENGYASPLNPLAGINAYDIESIEVLKNASATALYGAAGANGVIVVTTRNPAGDKLRVDWHSNAGVNISRISDDVFRPGIAHDHHVSVVANQKGTDYYLSANFRDVHGATPATFNNNVGLRLGFDSHANASVQFGMDAIISLGENSNPSATGLFGCPSLMSTLRKSTSSEVAAGWINDYDNYSDDYRFCLSTFLDVKIANGLVWKNQLGVDYHFLNRYFWYGNGTSFGLAQNGAASILGNSLFNDRFNSSLDFDRFFAKNHIKASLGFEQNSALRRFNQIPATDFFDHSLRAKGVNLSSKMVKLNRHQLDLHRLAAFATLDYDWDGAAGLNAVVRTEFLPRYFDSKPVVYAGIQAFVDVLRPGADLGSVSTLRIDGGWGKSGFFDYLNVPFGGDIEEGTEPFYENLLSLDSSEANLGVEFGLANDRFTFGVTAYSRRTEDTDAIYCFGKNKPNKSKVGGDFMWDYDERFEFSRHSSVIVNKGLEFDLGVGIIRNSSFRWDLDANLALNSNSFEEVAPEDAEGSVLGNSLVGNRAVKGEQVGAIYGYDRPANAFAVLGNSIPNIYGGLTSTLRAGKFSAEICIDGAAGMSLANLNLVKAAQEEPYGISSDFVEKADFLRLSRIAVAYEFSPSHIKCIKGLAFSLGANNLYTLTSYSGWNPDTNVFGLCPGTAGMDWSACPPYTSVVLGVNVKF